MYNYPNNMPGTYPPYNYCPCCGKPTGALGQPYGGGIAGGGGGLANLPQITSSYGSLGACTTHTTK